MFEYKPSPTGIAFHDSDVPIKMIMGPFGSGKSTICAMDIMYNAMAQYPDEDGVRYTRWGVIRKEYSRMRDSTIRTIMEVMPRGSGTITIGTSPIKGLFRFPLHDGTKVQIEFELWSVKDEAIAAKFQSCNWTGAWFNEATEVTRPVLNFSLARINRFPTPADMCRWGGVILDFNLPPRGHWLYQIFNKGELHNVVDGMMETTKTFSITQPPAAFKIEEEGRVRYVTNPNAENLENLKGGEEYYQLQVDSWVNSGEAEKADSLFCLLDAPTKSGQAVWPTFNHRRHVAFQKIEPLDEVPLIIGFDTSGIHPAAVFLQAQQGRWCVTDELYGDEVGLDSFLHSALVPLVRGRYPRCDITVSVDPANARDSFNALAPSTVLKEVGFKVVIPKTNSVKVRIEAVSVMLNQELGGLMVSPHCERLVDALDGGGDERGYHFRRLRISGSLNVAYSATPEKNEASHIADALQYACLHINQLRNSRAENDPGLVLWRERDNRRRQILVA